MELYAHALKLREKWGGPLNPDFDAAPETKADRRIARPPPPRGAVKPMNVWRPLRLALHDLIDNQAIVSLPASVRTPSAEWGYGAEADLLEAGRPCAIRVGLQVQSGAIGVCLVSEDYNRVVVDAGSVSPEDGELQIVIDLPRDPAPLRLVLRNYGAPGISGEVVLRTLEILEQGWCLV